MVIAEVGGDVTLIDDFTSVHLHVDTAVLAKRLIHLLHERKLNNITINISALLQFAHRLFLLTVDLNLCLLSLCILGPLTLLLPYLPSDSCLFGCIRRTTLISLLEEALYVPLDLIVEIRANSFLVTPVTDSLREASSLQLCSDVLELLFFGYLLAWIDFLLYWLLHSSG